MHLHDWNAYRRQLVAAVGDFAKLSPDTVKGYVTLGSAGQKVGRLGNKTRELIALAAAISLRCDGCIAACRGSPGTRRDQRRDRRSTRCRRRHQRGGGSRLLDSRVGCVRRLRRSLITLWKGASQCPPISGAF